MSPSSRFSYPHVPAGKEDDVEYWRNRALRSEVEIYALRRSVIEANIIEDISIWERIKRLLTSGS